MKPITNCMDWLTSLSGIAVVGLCAVMPGTALAQGQKAASGATSVTFAKDVAPIFQQKCEVCHRKEGMAPMSLVTFDEVRPWARSIKTKVIGHEMPPWYIDKTVGIQQFANDRSLSDAQIATIVRWVDAGALPGSAKDMPVPKQWPADDVWQLAETFGRPPDLIIRSPEYKMPAVTQDRWWQPMSDFVFPEDRWAAGTETRPTLKSRKVVHHAGTTLFQREDPAYNKAREALLKGQGSADAGALSPAKNALNEERLEDTSPDGVRFSEWAIGKNGEIYSEYEAGQFLRKGARMGFDVHLFASGEETVAQVETAFWFYPKGVTPKYRALKTAFGGNVGNLEIPPGKITVHEGYFVLPAPAIVLTFQPHMHLRGKAFAMEALYPDGRTEILNYVDRYAFNWHINYIYTKDSAPVLPKGTIIKTTAWHDNTAANKSNPDPTQWVAYGQRSVDEMAHSNEVVIYVTQADYDRITGERKQKKPASTQVQQ
jgi:mono/diheme cytochrome c family protein